MDKRWVLLLIASALIAGAIVGCRTKQTGHPQFTAGRQAMMRGEYEPAIQKLQVYLREKPNGKLASRASFLIAKAYLGLGKTGESRQQFEQTIRKYADSEEAHKSKYKLAMLSMLGGDHDDARKRFAALTGKPSGTLVPEAAAMLRYLDQQNSAKPTGDE